MNCNLQQAALLTTISCSRVFSAARYSSGAGGRSSSVFQKPTHDSLWRSPHSRRNALTGVRLGLQVLVYHDLLGMMQHPHHAKVTPKFCKQYAAVGQVRLLSCTSLTYTKHNNTVSDVRPHRCCSRLVLGV